MSEITGIRRKLAKFAATSCLAALCLAQPAFAQAAEDAPQDESAASDEQDVPANDEIRVTGSRTRSGFTAATPTLVIGTEELQQRGVTNVYSLLSELPAFSSRLSGAANGVRTQTPGQTFADLRGLGSPRTLVLIDGRRFVPSVPASSVGNPYQVDLNLIPTLMIERADIVTGGASAQWGSDAVAGVVNLILKKQVDGIQMEAQAGVSELGDAAEYRIGAVGGFSFAGDRGHVVLSGDYSNNQGIGTYRSRDWSDDYWQFFTDPTATAANGRPRNILRSGTEPGNYTPGGLIVNATGGTAGQRAGLIGLQFTSPTTTTPFVRGEFNPATTATTFAANQIGGGNPDLSSNSMIASTRRKVFYGHADYEISPALTVYVDASWGQSHGESINQPIRDRVSVYSPTTLAGSQVRIYADNPYIPAALRSLIPAPAGASTATPPAQSFVLSRVNYDTPLPYTIVRSTAVTGTIGVNGDLGGGWTWDASYTHGENEYFRRSSARNRTLYAMAADVVTSPVTGQPICRSTLTNPSNGCVPLNLFGNGSQSAAAIAYYSAEATAKLDYIQDAAQLNIQGSPFSTWAGPVAIAAGVEYRHESLNSVVDAVSLTGVYDSSVGGQFAGSFSVREGYVEATVPLAANLPFAHALTLNGAVRYADYTRFGGVTTWKAGATWEPVQGLLIRGTHSLDIRAPSLYELLVPPTVSLNNVVYNGVTYPGVRVANVGNVALQPERSKTTTIGVSWSPGFVRSLRLSVDLFDIRVSDVIANVGQAEIARLCGLGVASYCNLLQFSGGALIGVTNQFLNLSSFETRGMDLAASYSLPLAGGDLNLRANATYVDKFTIIVPGGPGEAPSVNEQAGQLDQSEGAVPHWKANFSATYSQKPFSVTGQVRFVSAGVIDNAFTEVPTNGQPADVSHDDNAIGAYALFNLSGTIDAGDRFQFFWVVNNVLDRDPPIIPSTTLLTQTNGTNYDVVGRFYKAGVRLRF